MNKAEFLNLPINEAITPESVKSVSPDSTDAHAKRTATSIIHGFMNHSACDVLRTRSSKVGNLVFVDPKILEFPGVGLGKKRVEIVRSILANYDTEIGEALDTEIGQALLNDLEAFPSSYNYRDRDEIGKCCSKALDEYIIEMDKSLIPVSVASVGESQVELSVSIVALRQATGLDTEGVTEILCRPAFAEAVLDMIKEIAASPEDPSP